MDKDLESLYNIYKSNIKVEDESLNENNSPIKVGDIIVALYNNREIRGEISSVYESYFLIKNKNGGSIKVTLDDITEHYPKNRQFNKKIAESIQQKQVEPPVEKKERPARRKNTIEEIEEKEQKNSPDNQVDITIESSSKKVKQIGKLIYYKNVKFSEISDMFEKKLLSKDEYWYLLTEKSNEIHVIRNNEKGFEIQPFVNSLVGHFLKSQSKMINESYNQLKISGNNHFSVISNVPQNIHKQLLNSLISLLSK